MDTAGWARGRLKQATTHGEQGLRTEHNYSLAKEFERVPGNRHAIAARESPDDHRPYRWRVAFADGRHRQRFAVFHLAQVEDDNLIFGIVDAWLQAILKMRQLGQDELAKEDGKRRMITVGLQQVEPRGAAFVVADIIADDVLAASTQLNFLR